MRFQYCVIEVSVSSWQEIMDSDDMETGQQHLNKWGDKGWELITVVPQMENGTTSGYALVFKRPCESNVR